MGTHCLTISLPRMKSLILLLCLFLATGPLVSGLFWGDADSDGDGVNDANDDDGDGILDGDEDDDADGVENDEDPDDDGDGVLDENDELENIKLTQGTTLNTE